jgi:hypothetical protein
MPDQDDPGFSAELPVFKTTFTRNQKMWQIVAYVLMISGSLIWSILFAWGVMRLWNQRNSKS